MSIKQDRQGVRTPADLERKYDFKSLRETTKEATRLSKTVEALAERVGDGLKSPYDVAVENGFVGTEVEWLESLKGEKGEQGIQGIQGEKGDKGEQGIQGEKGETGDQGIQGIQGEKGADGLPGAKGDKGDRGEKGDKGDTGDDGLAIYVSTEEPVESGAEPAWFDVGVVQVPEERNLQNGDLVLSPSGKLYRIIDVSSIPSADYIGTLKGEKGDKGEQGTQGEKGDKGDQGIQGEQGIQGIQGEKGDKGEQGIQGEKGETGDQGIQGIQGEKGADGLPGAKGDKGDRGEKGDKGDTGAAAGFGTPIASVDANVGTPSVTVTSSGDNTSKVFNFSFKNLKGETGSKGDKGDTGAAGANGVSVTHSWNGTTLTVSSASGTSSSNLKGDKGDKGDTGSTGATGAQGAAPIVLLWENSSKASTFASQTITISSLSNYNLYMVVARYSTTVSGATNCINKIGYSCRLQGVGANSSNNEAIRTVSTSGNNMTFGNCTLTGVQNNSFLIPIFIYGIKI